MKKLVVLTAFALVVMVALTGILGTMQKEASLSASAQTAELDEEGEKEEMRSISVSGSAELSAAPEKVEVLVSIVTESLKALDAQQKNADASAKVLAALQAAGFPKTSIETISYSLQENREWEEFSRKYELKGYKAINSLKITSLNTNDAGKIIDTAIGAGANQVDNIAFSLTDNKVKELKLQALKAAGAETLQKAQALAESVGVQIKQLETMSEGSTYYYPVYKSYGLEASGAPAYDAAPTEIIAGQIKVSAQVSATYSIV